jgi:DNA modification methylase
MGGEKGDLLLTDPPYGVSYIEKNAAVNGGRVLNNIGKEIKNDTGTVEEMAKLWAALYSHDYYFTDEASYYVFSPQGGELMMMMMQAIHQSKWQLKHSLIWQKQNFVFGRCDYHYQHEPVLYGWKKKGKHNWYADRSQSSLLQFDKPHKSDLHPTTKPVDLLEYLIGNSTKANDKVVDIFSGSGSTLIACEKTGRCCFGMEIDPHYCQVILERFKAYSGKDWVKI